MESSLPVELTRFIGREREIALVREMLERTRLLTITGAGGSGKTRLAREVAAQVAARDPGRVGWIELAPLADPDLLPHRIAATLGVREEAGQSITDSVIDFLERRDLLLVLDNCEHLVEACASLVDLMLRRCAGLRFLATSREALGVGGERAWLVPPLSLPEPSAHPSATQLAESEAVQLFVERATDALPSFRLTDANAGAIAQVCRRLDGIPLAIELAAARVRVLAPDQILERLDDAFRLLAQGSRTAIPRHQTLRATVDWSHRLLSRPEQVVLERLSVFAGDFSLESAEAVCAGEGVATREVLDLVARLVDRSLVQMQDRDGTARYSLLEIVRQYGRGRAAGGAADRETRRRHAAHYTELAEAALPHLERTNSSAWVEKLRLEQDNLRAALHWSLTEGNDPELALRLVAALWRYWFHTNLWKEGAAWCEAMIALVPEREPDPHWVRTLNGAGVFAYLARDSGHCRRRLEEAEAMSLALADSELLALTGYRLAHLFCDLGEHQLALAHAEGALRHARESGQPWVIAEVLVYAVAFVHRVQGRPDEADRAFAEANELAHSAGAYMGLTEAFMGRALLALQRGDVSAAAEHAAAAFTSARSLADNWYLSRALLIAAAAALHGNDAGRAARLLGCGTALHEAAGTQVFPHEQAFFSEVSDSVERELGEAESRRLRAEGAALTIHEVAGLVHGAASARAAATAAPRSAPSRALLESASQKPAAEVGAPALRVLTLGRTEIHLNGELLPPDEWAYAKPLELLLYLLMHPEGRTREQIGLAFWRDSSPAQAKNAFHVALHHLRKRLGRADWVLFEGDRYRVNQELGVELDASRFEERMKAALRQARTGDASVTALRSALAGYRGDFLETRSAGDWHLEHRDHLRRLHLDGLLALAKCLMAEERFSEAVEVYEELVRKENLDEAAHRGLMQAWVRTGDRTRALRHYDRLVVLLREELDAHPEPETVRLVEAFRSGRP